MILVVGARGMLGRDLCDVLGGEVRGVDVQEVDITSPESTRRLLLTLRPHTVINCAAYTNVDGCESNAGLAMQVNGEGVGHLARASMEIGAKLVQISTDYVFDGSGNVPLQEDDPVSPLSVYGESKLAGEMHARAVPDHLVVRTQWLYGVHGGNFVETMLRLAGEREEVSVVDDQFGSPTWTVDLAAAIKALLDAGCRGTYHAANAGSCSWYDFAAAIFTEAGLPTRVLPTTTAELKRPAKRPLYSVLNCDKLVRHTGFRFQPWRQALVHYLAARRNQ